VTQAGDALRFPLEAADKLFVIDHRRMEHLHGDVPIEAGLEGLVDVGHSAASEARQHSIPSQGRTGKISHASALSGEAWQPDTRAGAQAYSLA
jgi:hypothetical protein